MSTRVGLLLAAVATLLSGLPLAASAEGGYGAVAVVQPAEKATIFDNTGHVMVVVDVRPALQTGSGDRLVILLDGTKAADGAATNVQLSGVVRGTHVVRAEVVDHDGQVLIASAPVTFYMWHASALFPSRRK